MKTPARYLPVFILAVCFAAAAVLLGGCGTDQRSPFPNHAPVITTLTTSKAKVQPSGLDATTLTAAATDPDGDTLTVSWSSSAAGSAFTASTTLTTDFTSTATGTYTVTVTVRDPLGVTAATSTVITASYL